MLLFTLLVLLILESGYERLSFNIGTLKHSLVNLAPLCSLMNRIAGLTIELCFVDTVICDCLTCT
jgi:hypothetical protein